MYLIILFLHNPDLLEELLKEWNDEGVDGATVLFSTGMERLLQKQGIRDDIPLIPSLDDFYKAPETLSRTIFAVIKEEAQIDKVLAATQRVTGDLNTPGAGVFLVMPVLKTYGFIEQGRKK
ncbi:MAG: hypothetical protein Q8L41_00210 [Anaerolineales bacterium]|nr:hypothetical protein [Anaerolineales bacterium]MDP2777647.1 hypothetical protein [Anaerolineales bacterium]